VTHWFDDLARTAAGDRTGVSRRGVFAGAAVAAVAASPVASGVKAHAAVHVRGIAAQAGCQPCLNLVIHGHNRRATNCRKSGNPDRARPPRNKKGKFSPVSAAKKLACLANSRAQLGESLNECRKNNCQGASAPPVEAAPGAGGCPPGTYSCNDGPAPTCCYGGDVCCACPTGTICCVIAVGCTCC
jgi:hypothetical protein